MQKKKNMRLGNKEIAGDILVTLFCLIGIAFGLYFFNQAINQSFDKINETPIGTITFKENSAQRKLLDRILWDRLKQESPVYNGDLIRTAEFSEATILFTDGNVMNLYEQTLAQVFLDTDGAAVDFAEGGISLDTTAATTGMTLRAGSATVQLESGSSLNAAVAEKKEEDAPSVPLSLQMISGSANMVSTTATATVADVGTEEIITLTEGNTLALSEEGQIVEAPLVTVLSPTMNEKFLKQTGEKLPVIFKWKSENLEQDDYITIETSKTRDFSILTEQISFSDINEASLDMPVGAWYWRMYPESDKEQSVDGRLQVLDAPIPEPIVPAKDYEYRYRTKTPAIRFMWTNDDYANSWQFEVANNAQMNNPVISQRSTQPSSIISSLEKGTWYWQVTPLYSAGISTQITSEQASSVISSFTITQAGELEAVKLMRPAKDSFVDTAVADEGFHFSWQHDFESAHYNIAISKEEDLSSPLIEQNVTENYFVLMPEIATLENGQWYWAVSQIDSEGNQSPQSEVRSFLAIEGDVIQSTIFPPDGYILAENLVSDTRFTWKTNLPFAMRFQVASDRAFTNTIIDRILTNSSISDLDLPIGTWYWRIVADTEKDTLEYHTSPKTVTAVPYLEAVSMNPLALNDNMILHPNTPVEYIWAPVKDAQYYEVRLYHASDLNTPIYENLTIKDTSFSIDMEDMQEGEYLWTTVAMVAETAYSTHRSGVVAEKTFTMRNLRPIELVSPASRTEFDGIDAILNPIQVRWSSVETPVNSEFILSKRNVGLSVFSRDSGSRPSPYLSIKNPSTTVNLSELSAGTWYWTVIAETEDSANITALYPRSFVVLPIPSLSAPSDLHPQDKMIFDDDYFSTQFDADFSWDAVDGADSYIFRIKNSANKTIVEERIDNKTSYHIENLEILNNGVFTWTLEAIDRLPDDSIIRRSNIMSRTFTIDLVLATPSALFPQDKMIFDDDYFSTRFDADFSWDAVEYADSYIFRIKNSANKTIMEERVDNKTSYHIEDFEILNNGVFTWTLEAIDRLPDDSIIRRSNIMSRTFTIDFLLAAPRALSPQDKMIFDGDYFSTRFDADFSWNAIEYADSYIFRIKNSANKTIMEERIDNKTSYHIENLEILNNGVFTWTLEAIDRLPDDSIVRRSNIMSRTFTIDLLLATPSTLSPQNEMIFDDDYFSTRFDADFSWDAVEGADSYIFRIKNSANKMIMEERIDNKTSYHMEDLEILNNGVFTWTLEATDRLANDSIVRRSNIMSRTFTIDIVLAAPSALSPQDGMIFDVSYLSAQHSADFSWDAVEGADGYIFSIKDATSKTIMEERIDNKTSYHIENLGIFGRGLFTWTIETVDRLPNDSIIRQSKVMSRTFTIDLPHLKMPDSKNTGEFYGL